MESQKKCIRLLPSPASEYKRALQWRADGPPGTTRMSVISSSGGMAGPHKSACRTKALVLSREAACTRYRARSKQYDHTPSHLYNAGTEHVGFHRPERHHKHKARNAVRCSASLAKGGLHQTKNRF